ncbi:hypothetical protein [Haematobacter missouriensis]|nr:hypothetical protein [Haematobacter missouriensis]
MRASIRARVKVARASALAADLPALPSVAIIVFRVVDGGYARR